jgi:uncharacterized membrane protein YkvA (DUF1232 family)
MSDSDARYLELFPAWLRSLGEDVRCLGELVGPEQTPAVRRQAVAAVNYIFKSLDLIPDGIDDLGFLDDAFVLRVASSLALAEEAGSEHPDALARLGREAGDVKAFLGPDYERLEAYVRGLRKSSVRGRTVDDVVNDDGIRHDFVREVQEWAQSYAVPSFTRDPKTLIKLRAFLRAKLA